jgi:hypothetical protein
LAAVGRDGTIVRWLLDQLVQERAAELPGASLVSAQLAQLLMATGSARWSAARLVGVTSMRLVRTTASGSLQLRAEEQR